jgi:hypothetical protein
LFKSRNKNAHHVANNLEANIKLAAMLTKIFRWLEQIETAARQPYLMPF